MNKISKKSLKFALTPPEKIVLGTIIYASVFCLVLCFLIIRNSTNHVSNGALGTKPLTYSSQETTSVNSHQKESPDNSLRTTNSQEAGCYSKPIPYKTIKKKAIWLYVGETKTERGFDGKERVCTLPGGNKTRKVVTTPLDAILYVGTKKDTPQQTTGSSYSFEQALSLATQTCRKLIPAGSWDSTDMSDCKTREMRKYGY